MTQPMPRKMRNTVLDARLLMVGDDAQRMVGVAEADAMAMLAACGIQISSSFGAKSIMRRRRTMSLPCAGARRLFKTKELLILVPQIMRFDHGFGMCRLISRFSRHSLVFSSLLATVPDHGAG